MKNKKGNVAVIAIIIVIVAITASVITWLVAKKSLAPVQKENATQNKEIQSKKEYVNSIESAGGGIFPTVRDRIDYASFEFELSVAEESKQNLIHVDRVDFYDNRGDFLGSMPKEKFTIDIVDTDPRAINLKGTVPLSVGSYFRGIRYDEVIKFELLSGNKVLLSDTLKYLSDPYRLSLVKNNSAPDYGCVLTRITLDTRLVPEKCDLYNEKDEKILEMEPKNMSNPSVFIKDIPKTTISVCAVCYLSDGSTVKTDYLLLGDCR